MAEPTIKFGDAELAREVIELIVDDDEQFDHNTCDDLDIEQDRCLILQEATVYGYKKPIDEKKKQSLAEAGFSDEFISALTGADGLNIARARAEWLADHYEDVHTGLFGDNNLLRELRSYGEIAAPYSERLIRSLKDVRPERSDTLIGAAKLLAQVGSPSEDGEETALNIFNMVRNDDCVRNVSCHSFGNDLYDSSIMALGAVTVHHDLVLPMLLHEYATYNLGARRRIVVDSISRMMSKYKNEVIVLLKNEDPVIRECACQVIEDWGASAVDAVPALVDIVESGKEEAELGYAIMALGAIGPAAKDAVPAIVERFMFLKDWQQPDILLVGNGEWRGNVIVETLSKIGIVDEGVRTVFSKALASVQITSTAAESIERFGRKIFPEFLNAFSKNQISDENAIAYLKKADITVDDIEPFLSAVPNSVYSFNIFSYAEIIARLKEPAVAPLLKSLQNCSGKGCLIACKALSMIGGNAEEIVPRLLEMVNVWLQMDYNAYNEAREEAKSTIKKLGAEAIPPLLAAFENGSILTQLTCIKLLQDINIPDPRMVALLVHVVDNSENEGLVNAGIEALGTLKVKEAFISIYRRLESSSEDIRGTAAAILGELGELSARALPRLSKMRHTDINESVRGYAERAVAQILDKVE